MEKSFRLQEFNNKTPNLTITGKLTETPESLRLNWQTSGPLNQEIAWPVPEDKSQFKRGLWQATCFELFLRNPGAKKYWEFNFSPASNWAVFSFSDYREEEENFNSAPFKPLKSKTTQSPEFSALEVELAKAAFPPQPWCIGVSAIILFKDGRKTYWALTHRGPDPDFHNGESFTLTLP